MPTEEAHKKLLLLGFAIYASPENLSKYADIVISEDSVSYSSEATQEKLPLVSKIVTPVVMSGEDYSEKWSVEPWHIRTALRTYAGVHLESDECIRIPSEKTIEGPNLRYSPCFYSMNAMLVINTHVPNSRIRFFSFSVIMERSF